MSARHGTTGALLLLVAAQAPLAAQGAVEVRAATLYEQYSFDAGLVFSKITELTVPVGFTWGLGRFGSLALSTGYASVELTSASAQLGNQSVAGALDTELRLSVNLVPGKLILIANGALPTGTKTVQQEELSILGAISSDVIGFSASTLGTGGNMGGGIAGAVPLGGWALGFGGTYKLPLTYQPILGRTDELKPGAEIKLRTGLEGGLGRNTYVRLAGIYARTAKDEVAGKTLNGVGNRMIGYFSLNQQIGRATLILYGFDVFRGSPQVEATAAGAALLNRGNLLAGGARLTLALGRTTQFTPRFEFRRSTAAADTLPGSPLDKLGQSLRIGMDLRREFSRSFAAVLQAGRVSGDVIQDGAAINFNGFRAALHAEIRP